MPGIVLPVISGGTNILSGNTFSGQGPRPYSEVRLATPFDNSGVVWVTFSGGNTAGLSGSFPLSGLAGVMDGFPMSPNSRYNVPRSAFQTSGLPAIFVQPSPAGSGRDRIYWESV